MATYQCQVCGRTNNSTSQGAYFCKDGKSNCIWRQIRMFAKQLINW